MSKVHIIVGATDTGKSFFLKEMLKKVPNKNSLYIYDIENEYKNFFPYPLVDFEEFVSKAVALSNCIMVFEEATIFFSSKSSSKELRTVMVQKKHTHNTVFLVFHSLRSVPRYIYELSDFITIFKTNDSPGLTAKELKDDRLEKILMEVNSNTDTNYCKIIDNMHGKRIIRHYHETLKIK